MKIFCVKTFSENGLFLERKKKLFPLLNWSILRRSDYVIVHKFKNLTKKRKACSSSSERRRKDVKRYRTDDEFKACFSSWNESMAAKKEASLTKAERYRKEGSVIFERYHAYV